MRVPAPIAAIGLWALVIAFYFSTRHGARQ